MKKTLIVLAAIFLLAGCAAAPTTGVSGADSSVAPTTTSQTAAEVRTASAEEAPAQGAVTATFKVTTTGKADVRWGSSAGVSQADILKGSWSIEAELKAIDAVMLMVTAVDFEKSQTVTCEILINGVSRSKNTGKGNTANATCDATTPN